MKLIKSMTMIEEPICISLGNFDGLHIAHRKLIEHALEVGKKKGLATAVLTFSPHPKEFFFGRGPEQILPHHLKDAILESMGVDYLIVLPFNITTATMEPEVFIKEILLEKFNAKYICVGYNYHFGDKQMGNVYLLDALKEKFGYELYIQKEIRTQEMSVSSTAIRDMINEGNVALAGTLLGYFPFIEGTVVKGNCIGRSIGFPTANINLNEKLLVPKVGVYMGYVKEKDAIHRALINVGKRPTIGDNFETNIEAHLLDYSGDLYDKTIQISFTERIRDEVKFDTLEELRHQLQEDEELTRQRMMSESKNIAKFPDSLY
ncbi:bifunctional riboflavin kinase/FAD synthetase [Clostridia bacterium]|nr:bifunctional riboflavin kinase/FAD synthetase [Clostridia bacterium]